MDLLIFFSIVFATIIFAIILERIIHCPVLVGFAFFAIFLIVAAVLNNTTYIIIAIVLGILAFIVAFLDCVFRSSNFFRNNGCLRDNNEDIHNNNLGISLVSDNGNILNNSENNCSSCSCSNRSYGMRRY